MGKWSLSERSISKLNGVHPDLIRVIEESIKNSPYDFGITSGLRTINEQKKLVQEGKSRTIRSRHLSGHAVDIVVYVDGKATWEKSYYDKVAGHILGVAAKLSIPIIWGGTFKGFYDGPHFELNRAFY